MSVEASRRHGPFDYRYPLIRHKPSPPSLRGRGEDRIGWDDFLARFYPHSRRHDFDVVAAYESYAIDVGAVSVEETERWEGEGGAVAERGQRAQILREGPLQGFSRTQVPSRLHPGTRA